MQVISTHFATLLLIHAHSPQHCGITCKIMHYQHKLSS